MAHLTRFTLPADPGHYLISAAGSAPRPVAVGIDPALPKHLAVWAEVDSRPGFEVARHHALHVVAPEQTIPEGFRFLGAVTLPGIVTPTFRAVYAAGGLS